MKADKQYLVDRKKELKKILILTGVLEGFEEVAEAKTEGRKLWTLKNYLESCGTNGRKKCSI